MLAVNFPSLSQVPAHLCTSPLPLELPEETAEAPEGSFITGSGTRRKKRRRKRMRSDTHLREDVSSSSDEREREKEEWERESDQAGQEGPVQEELVTALQMRSVIKTLTTELMLILSGIVIYLLVRGWSPLQGDMLQYSRLQS